MRSRVFAIVAVVCFAILLSSVALAGSLSFDRGRAKSMLNVVASEIEKNYYDPTMGGVNWTAAIEEARQKIEAAKTNGEMMTAIFLLIDKLHDSHTRFLPPGRVVRPQFGFSAQPVGDEIRVYHVNRTGAAEAAGLQVGDRILKVNGFDVNRQSWDEMMMYYRVLRPTPRLEVVYSRGAEGPKTATIDAKLKEQKRITDLTGQDIWTLIRESEKNEPIHRTATLDQNIGYLHLSAFNRDNFDYLVGDIKNAEVAIIDLRRNPGGLVVGLRDLVGHMETGEGVLQTVVTRKKTEEEKFKANKPAFSGKMVILIDSHSASAAEIFARHFQSNGRAIVVGDRSSGRVNQSRFFGQNFGDGMTVAFYGIQIAVGQVVLPGGEKLEKTGVVPDVTCLPTGDDLRGGKDPCLERAVAIARRLSGKDESVPDGARVQIAQLVSGLAQDLEKMKEE